MLLANVEASCMGFGNDIPHGNLDIEVYGLYEDDQEQLHALIHTSVLYECPAGGEEVVNLTIFVKSSSPDSAHEIEAKVVGGEGDILAHYPSGTTFKF